MIYLLIFAIIYNTILNETHNIFIFLFFLCSKLASSVFKYVFSTISRLARKAKKVAFQSYTM